MVLVSYLVFFLVGLAYGLAQDNRTSVDKWDADGIIPDGRIEYKHQHVDASERRDR